jgi:hypothetical protein
LICLDLEDQERAERTVSELEQIETSAEAVKDDGVSVARPAVPRLAPTPAQVRIRTEDILNIYVYDAFVVCGATTRVAAFLSKKVVTMKGLAKLAHDGGVMLRNGSQEWLSA